MRHTTLLLSLFLASNAALAQSDGLMIFETNKPYVSPFDKASPGKEVSPKPSQNKSSQENGEQKTSDSATIIIQPPTVVQKPKAVPRATPAKRVERVEPVIKASPTLTPERAISVESKAAAKPTPAMAADVVPKQQALPVVPPLPQLSSPDERSKSPAALFDSPTSQPEPMVRAPVVPEKIIPKIVAPDPFAENKVLEVPKPSQTIDKRETPSSVSSESSEGLGWLAKLVAAMLLLGTCSALGFRFLKRHPNYGDPAYKDPWFRPIKTR